MKEDDRSHMTTKQLKKLSRKELIELLLEEWEESGTKRQEAPEADPKHPAKVELDQEQSEGNPESEANPEHKRKVSIRQLKVERARLQYKKRYYHILRSTIGTLITVAAVAVLVATLWMPVLRIYGSSMAPTLQDGEIILSQKTSDFAPGDIVSFYYNNKILVKRVIGQAGDWIDIREDGTVYVNQIELEEPYLVDKSLGDCDIELPYQVPDGKLFVMGDHRSVSVDSRNTAIGCVAQEQIVGKIIFRIWPLKRLGAVE